MSCRFIVRTFQTLARGALDCPSPAHVLAEPGAGAAAAPPLPLTPAVHTAAGSEVSEVLDSIPVCAQRM